MKEGFVEALVLRAGSGRAWRRFVDILPPGLRFLPPVIPSLPCSPLVLAPFLAPLLALLPQVAPPDKRVSYHDQHLYCDNCKPCRKYNGSAGVAHYGRAFSFSGLGYMGPVFPAKAGIHITVAYGNLLVVRLYGFPPARERRENEKALALGPERLRRSPCSPGYDTLPSQCTQC